ncbi:MAG: response regulator [Candidatus Helarchaeota archaeon]
MKYKAKIIVIDDDDGITETLKYILEKFGYTVSVANSGFEAIEMIKKFRHNVALLDFMMPGINGIETFKEIKKINPSINVIMMTAYSLDDFLKEAKKEGVIAVLQKPFNINNVIELIKSVC